MTPTSSGPTQLQQGPKKAAAVWLHRPQGIQLPPNAAILAYRHEGQKLATPVVVQRVTNDSAKILEFLVESSPLYAMKHFLIGKTLQFK